MNKLKIISVMVLFGFFQASQAEEAQNCLPPDAPLPANWTEPYEAHRVIGNLYAVGGAGLSAYLVTSEEGHVLINTGLTDSTPWMRKNIASLGFDIKDVKVLLTTQAHFDHTAALAEIKQLTGAKMLATPDDARVLADGGRSDAHFGQCLDLRFEPIPVDGELAHGQVISLGTTRLKTHHHPGHTEGSSSYSMTVTENGRDYFVLIANMASINDGKKLLNEPTYSGVADDFALTFSRQMALPVDVWVASHGGQYDLVSKHKPGQAYSPEAFVDPIGFQKEVARLEQLYLTQLARERSLSAK